MEPAMTSPSFTPPPGTGYEAGPQVFQYPPQLPGYATAPPAVTTPSVPATTVAATNTTGVNVIAYITAGSGASITQVKVGGTSTGLQLAAGATAPVYLPASQAIILTYSGGTLTWVWLAV
jgi:hypothetical protein